VVTRVSVVVVVVGITVSVIVVFVVAVIVIVVLDEITGGSSADTTLGTSKTVSERNEIEEMRIMSVRRRAERAFNPSHGLQACFSRFHANAPTLQAKAP